MKLIPKQLRHLTAGGTVDEFKLKIPSRVDDWDGLMVLAVYLYRFFDMSVLIAARLFSLGSAIVGISLLIGRAGYSVTTRLIAAQVSSHSPSPHNPAPKRHTTNLPTAKMINKYLVRAAPSEAMDGAAPDLERDAPWREKQHARGTACANLLLYKLGH